MKPDKSSELSKLLGGLVVKLAAAQPRVGSAASELLALCYKGQLIGKGCWEHRVETFPEHRVGRFQPCLRVTSDTNVWQCPP